MPDLVEITRRRSEALNRHDFDAVMSFFAPNAVFDTSDLGVGVHVGSEAIRAFHEDWWGRYEEFETAPEEITQVGDNVVLMITSLAGRLSGSGEPVRMHLGYVFEFHDGLIVRWVLLQDADAARAAAERLAKERGQSVSGEPTTPGVVEAIRLSIEAFNHGDFDAAAAVFAQDPVWDTSPIGLAVYEGRDGVRDFLAEFAGAYEDYEMVLEEIQDLGNGVVFYVASHRGRPAGGTGFVELRHSYTVITADGLVARVTVRADIDEARDAAERLAKERG
jgi:ketosteroid isomerase-like protein